MSDVSVFRREVSEREKVVKVTYRTYEGKTEASEETHGGEKGRTRRYVRGKRAGRKERASEI